MYLTLYNPQNNGGKARSPATWPPHKYQIDPYYTQSWLSLVQLLLSKHKNQWQIHTYWASELILCPGKWIYKGTHVHLLTAYNSMNGNWTICVAINYILSSNLHDLTSLRNNAADKHQKWHVLPYGSPLLYTNIQYWGK